MFWRRKRKPATVEGWQASCVCGVQVRSRDKKEAADLAINHHRLLHRVGLTPAEALALLKPATWQADAHQ